MGEQENGTETQGTQAVSTEQPQEESLFPNPLEGLDVAQDYLSGEMEKQEKEAKPEEKEEKKETILADENVSEKEEEETVEQKEDKVKDSEVEEDEAKPDKSEKKEKKVVEVFKNPMLQNLEIEEKEVSEEEKATQKDVLSYINDNIGSDFKDIKEFQASYKGLQESLENTQKEASINQAAMDLLGRLPTQLFEAVSKFEQGEDYTSALKSNSIDFSRKFEDQDLESLVQTLAPRKLPEDFESQSELKEMLRENGDYDLLKSIYDTQKGQYDKQVEGHREKLQLQQAKLDESYAGTLKSVDADLGEMFGHKVNVQDKHSQEIARVLQGGQRAVLDMFFNEDGTYKSDAAAKVAFLNHAPDAYKELVSRVTVKAEKQAKTKAIETFVEKGGEHKAATTKVRDGKEMTMETATEYAKRLVGVLP